jgi:acetylornithine deacetylase/succinyl-diaminopimelate desuccinylase-like protein
MHGQAIAVSNVIPDSCSTYMDYRFLPGETFEGIVNRVTEVLHSTHADGEVRIADYTDTTYTGITFSKKKCMAGFELGRS